MSKFTKELVDDLANKLLIGLTDEENELVLSEFDIIDKNMELINKIPNIKAKYTYVFCSDHLFILILLI